MKHIKNYIRNLCNCLLCFTLVSILVPFVVLALVFKQLEYLVRGLLGFGIPQDEQDGLKIVFKKEE